MSDAHRHTEEDYRLYLRRIKRLLPRGVRPVYDWRVAFMADKPPAQAVRDALGEPEPDTLEQDYDLLSGLDERIGRHSERQIKNWYERTGLTDE